jgi:hypothetical protein
VIHSSTESHQLAIERSTAHRVIPAANH